MLKCLTIIEYNSSITLYAVAGYDSFLWQDGSAYLEYYTEVLKFIHGSYRLNRKKRPPFSQNLLSFPVMLHYCVNRVNGKNTF